MNFENILVSTENRIQTIIINRPTKLNALNKDTIAELSAALTQAENNADVRVIILTGSGEKSFVAGADISEFSSFDIAQGKDLAANGQKTLFDLAENLKKPVNTIAFKAPPTGQRFLFRLANATRGTFRNIV